MANLPEIHEEEDGKFHSIVDHMTDLGEQYFLPEAIELLRRTRDKDVLSDDDILLLAITATQAARAFHVEVGSGAAEATLGKITRILDHGDVIRAEFNKLYAMFEGTRLVHLDHDHD